MPQYAQKQQKQTKRRKDNLGSSYQQAYGGTKNNDVLKGFIPPKSIDLHRKKAAEILGIPVTQVTDKQRQIGKTINYHEQFGMSITEYVNMLKASPMA